MKSKKKNGDTA